VRPDRRLIFKIEHPLAAGAARLGTVESCTSMAAGRQAAAEQ